MAWLQAILLVLGVGLALCLWQQAYLDSAHSIQFLELIHVGLVLIAVVGVAVNNDEVKKPRNARLFNMSVIRQDLLRYRLANHACRDRMVGSFIN